MRRCRFAILALFVLGATANAGPPTAADLAALMIERGKPVLDLEADAKAVPGPGPSRTETTTQIQAAIDAFALPGLPFGRKTITVNGVYYTDRPIFLDVNDLDLKGDGESTISGFHGSSVIYLGIPRKPQGKALTTDHVYDLFGVLDATTVYGPGQRWGLRFRGDSHLAFGSSGLSVDAGRAKALTLDYCLDTRESGNQIGAIFGLEAYGNPAPFQIFRMDDYQGKGTTRTAVMFRTDDDVNHIAYFADPLRGVHRYTVQIDTDAAKVRVWIDGQAVTVDDGGLKGWKGGVELSGNSGVLPFKINSCGPRANWFGSDWWTFAPAKAGGLDFGLCGLHVSKALRYRDQDQQARIDGQPINDRTRYFTKDAATVGLLPLDQSPEELAESRSVKSYDQGWFGVSHGLFLSDGHDSEWSATKGNKLTGLKINNYAGNQNRFGEAVTLGFSLYTRIEDCTLEGGQHGLGTWNWGANYITRGYRSSFAGGDAAVAGYNGMFELTDCEIPSNGRHMIRLTMSSLNANRLWCSDGSAARTESYFRLRESSLKLTDFAADVESSDGPSVAVFDARTGTKGGTPNGGLLQVRNLDLAAPRPDVPIFLLSGPKGSNPGVIEMSGECRLYGDRKAPMVKVADPGSWSGRINLDAATKIGGVGIRIDDTSQKNGPHVRVVESRP